MLRCSGSKSDIDWLVDEGRGQELPCYVLSDGSVRLETRGA